MSELRFDGKVVVVTGAGRNLGREYALLFAARGARVLVNDLGVGISDTDGVADGADVDPPADAVVAEIVAAGGEAVANRDTIATPEGGRAIVDAALDAFGAVDVVVNNAGQVRMAPFAELTEAQLDAVIDTQLRGALNVSRPAWAVMAERGGGRFVNVSSGAAFGGVPGGAVYGMAKMGVIGLTRGDGVGGPRRRDRRQRDRALRQDPPGTGFGPFPASDELNEWLAPAARGAARRVVGPRRVPGVGGVLQRGRWALRARRPRGHRRTGRPRTRPSNASPPMRPTILDSPATPITATVSDNMRRMFEGFRPAGADVELAALSRRIWRCGRRRRSSLSSTA